MSGHYGWKGTKPDNAQPVNKSGGKQDTNFNAAYQAHGVPAPGQPAPAPQSRVVDINAAPSVVAQKPAPKVDTRVGQKRDFRDFQHGVPKSVPNAKHQLRSTAANVLIVVTDITGSLGTWPAEIFKRLPLLWDDAVAFFNSQDIEVLFIAFGDAGMGDRFPLQVTKFGREQELDSILATIELEGGGGGNGRESAELAAYYIATQVDTSSARNVSCFFITDEKGYDRVDAREVRNILGQELDTRVSDTQTLFSFLLRKMRTFAITINSGSYNYQDVQKWWSTVLPERVSQLDDPRRATDVIMGILAAVIGKTQLFESRLVARQGGTPYGAQNIATVQASVLMVAAADPRSRLKLPAPKMDGGVDPANKKDDWVD